MFQPLVSIIIPVYNGEDYLREAIDSALSQTYQNIEIIVVNDGSTDSSERIALSYGSKIRYFRKENGGVSTALNLGIRQMNGTYFSWLSHDDLYEPDKIEKQIEMLLDHHDDNLIAYCNSSHIDKNSAPIKSVHRCALPTQRVLPWDDVLHYLLKHGSFNGCALLIPKKVFDLCGCFNEELRYSQDVLMWYTVFSNHFSLIVYPDDLVKGRVHQNQQTQLHSDRLYTDGVRLTEIILPVFERISTENDDFVYEYLVRSLLHGNDVAAEQCIESLKHCKRLSFNKKIHILYMKVYGQIRPTIRKQYYSIFRKIKTE